MRVIVRVFVLAFAAAGLSMVVARPAVGQPYPIPGTGATVSAATVVAGDNVHITAGGYLPGETVSVDVAYQPEALGPLGGRANGGGYRLVAFAPVMTTVADSAGSVSVDVQLTQVGVAVITLTGFTSGVTNVARVSVRRAGGLPITGSDGRLLWTVLIGAGVVAVGVVVGALTSRRRRAVTSD